MADNADDDFQSIEDLEKQYRFTEAKPADAERLGSDYSLSKYLYAKAGEEHKPASGGINPTQTQPLVTFLGTKTEGDITFYEYLIQGEKTIKKRHSQFEELQRKLHEFFFESYLCDSWFKGNNIPQGYHILPILPKQGLSTGKVRSEEEIMDRAQHLRLYLTKLLTHPVLAICPPLQAFIKDGQEGLAIGSMASELKKTVLSGTSKVFNQAWEMGMDMLKSTSSQDPNEQEFRDEIASITNLHSMLMSVVKNLYANLSIVSATPPADIFAELRLLAVGLIDMKGQALATLATFHTRLQKVQPSGKEAEADSLKMYNYNGWKDNSKLFVDAEVQKLRTTMAKDKEFLEKKIVETLLRANDWGLEEGKKAKN
mgnify:CR=1 FL=1